MLNKIIAALTDRLKVEVFLAAAFGAQVNLWVGYFTAWGKMNWLLPEMLHGWIATGITGILSTVGAGALMIAMVRVVRLIRWFGKKADEAEAELKAGIEPTSVIRGVVLEEMAAKDFESSKIVGPSEATTLTEKQP